MALNALDIHRLQEKVESFGSTIDELRDELAELREEMSYVRREGIRRYNA